MHRRVCFLLCRGLSSISQKRENRNDGQPTWSGHQGQRDAGLPTGRPAVSHAATPPDRPKGMHRDIRGRSATLSSNPSAGRISTAAPTAHPARHTIAPQSGVRLTRSATRSASRQSSHARGLGAALPHDPAAASRGGGVRQQGRRPTPLLPGAAFPPQRRPRQGGRGTGGRSVAVAHPPPPPAQFTASPHPPPPPRARPSKAERQ